MPVRKQDAHRALELLQEYRSRLTSPEDRPLILAIDRVINIFQNKLFLALLDIQEFYETTLLDENKTTEEKTQEAMGVARRWETNPSAFPLNSITAAAAAAVANRVGVVAGVSSMTGANNSTGISSNAVGAGQTQRNLQNSMRAKSLQQQQQQLHRATGSSAMLSIETDMTSPGLGDSGGVGGMQNNLTSKDLATGTVGDDARDRSATLPMPPLHRSQSQPPQPQGGPRSQATTNTSTLPRSSNTVQPKQQENSKRPLYQQQAQSFGTDVDSILMNDVGHSVSVPVSMEVILDKGATGFGFSIAGGTDNPHVEDDAGIFVTRLTPGGVAEADGCLRVNDQIVSVNGVSVVGVTHAAAVEALRRAGNQLRLVIQRHPGNTNLCTNLGSGFGLDSLHPSSSDPMPPPPPEVFATSNSRVGSLHQLFNAVTMATANSNQQQASGSESAGSSVGSGTVTAPLLLASSAAVCSPAPTALSSPTQQQQGAGGKPRGTGDGSGLVIDVELTKGPRGLGFSIAGGRGNEHAENDPGIFITKVIEGGVAEADGRIAVGDRLIQVNQTLLADVTHEEAVLALKSTGDRVRLILVKTPQLPYRMPPPPLPPSTTAMQQQGEYEYAVPMRGSNRTGQPQSQPLPSTQSGWRHSQNRLVDDSQQGWRHSQGRLTDEQQQQPMSGISNWRHSQGHLADEQQSQPLSVAPNWHHSQGRLTDESVPLTLAQQNNWRYSQGRLGGGETHPIVPEWRQPRSVVLYRGPTGLGFNIVGGEGGDGIFISHIQPNKPADLSGKLFKGDRLLAVNGINLTTVTHEEAASVLMAATDRVEIIAAYAPEEYTRFEAKFNLESAAGGAASSPRGVGTSPAYRPPSVNHDGENPASMQQPQQTIYPRRQQQLQQQNSQPATGQQQLRPAISSPALHVLGVAGGRGGHVVAGSVANLNSSTGVAGGMGNTAAHGLSSATSNPTLSLKLGPGLISSSSGGQQNPKRSFFIRAQFDCEPTKDGNSRLPNKWLTFRAGDILQVTNASDDEWWQARRVSPSGPGITANETTLGIIPSKQRVERRERARLKKVNFRGRQQQQLPPSGTGLVGSGPRTSTDEEGSAGSGGGGSRAGSGGAGSTASSSNTNKYGSMKRKTQITAGGSADGVGRNSFQEEIGTGMDYSVQTYELVEQQKLDYTRPVVILGPLKDRINDELINEFPNRFGSCVPHTTRPRRDYEVDGRDYHFIDSRETMEQDIQAQLFIEAGQYNGNLYGTHVDSVRDVAGSGKHCILDVSGHAIRRLQAASLHPISILIRPDNWDQLRQWNRRLTEEQAQRTFERTLRLDADFGQYFTATVNGDSFDDLYTRVKEVIWENSGSTVWVPVEEDQYL